MPVREIGQEAKNRLHNVFVGYNPVKVLRFRQNALDLFPIKPIIGRNTLSQNEFTIQPLPYPRRYSGPYY